MADLGVVTWGIMLATHIVFDFVPQAYIILFSIVCIVGLNLRLASNLQLIGYKMSDRST